MWEASMTLKNMSTGNVTIEHYLISAVCFCGCALLRVYEPPSPVPSLKCGDIRCSFYSLQQIPGISALVYKWFDYTLWED
ncbi:hypothetical protein D918_05558 [Trichuris suis]|nr:hypothetical protein D918_05558 [Trichuris suis]